MLRYMNPRDRLAVGRTFSMWLLKERLSLISTHRYLEPPTDSRICLCSRYSLGTGVLARVIVYDNTLTGVEFHVPLKFPLMEMVKILLYIIFGHLAGWKLPSRWPCHQQTAVSLICSCQIGH